MNVYYSVHNTPMGKMFFASTAKGLCKLEFLGNNLSSSIDWLEENFHAKEIIENEKKNSLALEQITEYFSGKRHEFGIDLHLIGTDFQKKVWKILRQIKHGNLWTYKDVAIALGDAKKARAVGGAVGKNPTSIIIPCHRVIGTNGKLTGFSAPGGIKLKRKLLDLESVDKDR